MGCPETRKLIHGYVDGELDPVKSLEIAEHLQECAACAQAHAELQAMRAAIKSGSAYFKSPPDLQRRIQLSLGKASRGGSARRGAPVLWLAVAASLLLGVIAGWSLAPSRSSPSADTLLAQALVANHVRSQLLPVHRVDVESSDQHTVKPWFEGKVDFSPPVADLKDHEFMLVGGRLDYLNDRAVAALVYQRRKHLINLFVWPSTQGPATTTQGVIRQGFHLLHWTQSGMTYWVVSDLNETELQEFVRLVQDKSPN